jgi:hypothetical protein
MKKLLIATIVGAVALGLSSDAFAGQNPNANLAIDMQIPPAKGVRSCTPTYSSCSAVVQTRAVGGGAAAARYHAIVVLYRLHPAGVRGAEYRLSWGGAYFYGFQNCPDFIIGGADQGGFTDIAQTYSAPRVGPNPDPGTGGLTLGWLDVYSTVPFRVDFGSTELHGWPLVLGADGETDLVHTLHSGFGQGGVPGPGDLPPCTQGPTSTQATTWSNVKALYR